MSKTHVIPVGRKGLDRAKKKRSLRSTECRRECISGCTWGVQGGETRVDLREKKEYAGENVGVTYSGRKYSTTRSLGGGGEG